jgi:hypothetical protein
MTDFELLAVVAILRDQPEHSLARGQVGTIVERLGDGAFLVDFCDQEGRSYAIAPFRAEELIRLRHTPLERVA